MNGILVMKSDGMTWIDMGIFGTRHNPNFKIGTKVLIYVSKVGFVGTAIIESDIIESEHDGYKYRMLLGNVDLKEPIQIHSEDLKAIGLSMLIRSRIITEMQYNYVCRRLQ